MSAPTSIEQHCVAKVVTQGPATPDDSIYNGSCSIEMYMQSRNERILNTASDGFSAMLSTKAGRARARTKRKHDIEDLGLLVAVHSIADGRPVHLIVACSSQENI